MGGDITYEPNPGGGSIFTFTAVLQPASPQDVVAVVTTPAHPSTPSPPPDKGTVLVVEDNPVNQLVASGMLTALGYGVVTADDGVTGVELAARGGFVAILMDVQMPVLDGYAATRAIRAAESGPRVPVIAMTAAAVDGVRERCLEADMDDFLTKPVDVDRLASTLERWLVRAAIDATSSLDRLDLSRLDELRELDGGIGETSYVARAIGNLLGSAPRDLDAMDEAAAAGDAERLSSVSHRLAGAALNLGAMLGGEAARQLEFAVRSGRPVSDLPDRLAQVRETLVEDLRALSDLRDRLVEPRRPDAYSTPTP
jgi:CheY-like chemotaxis protein/HPt (histidine-containing phosphotransfer) domain-containing protein